MIELTRLNNRPLVVNSDLIKFIENTPDTVLTLTTGEKVVVSESCATVIEKVIEFRRKTSVGLSCLETASGHESHEHATAADDHIED
jgi:flagellar protein FlbD